MANDCPDDPAEGVDSLVVVYADETLPRLYEMSRMSQDQLPKHSGMSRSENVVSVTCLSATCLLCRLNDRQ